MDRGAPLIKAALPLIQDLDPKRLEAVLTALTQLQMLNDESVVLMMPELILHD
jgi:hypothetical protein